MKVFKFGGASVKDAQGVKNVGAILKKYAGEKIAVVISAMGKTTNALENLVRSKDEKEVDRILAEIKQYHFNILEELFLDKKNPVYNLLEGEFNKIKQILSITPSSRQGAEFDEEYDQVVSMGEVISSRIVSVYLNDNGANNQWVDAREVICTDDNYREGNVNFEKTSKKAKEALIPIAEEKGIVITQGFIGKTPTGKTTTLGREGSDYTAAVLAYCLDVESVTIWKDVPGVLNADPKWFDNTIKIDHLSYQDAIELSYYGATVIHPKTIKPLQNKGIPLFVKSFLKPEDAGTRIDNDFSHLPVPCFIFKVNQVLVSVSPKDFSFIVEENLSRIFKDMAKHKVKVNVMQNSALNFSICMDDDGEKVPALIETLKEDFRVLYNKNLELVTIRYYDQATIDRVCINKKVLMEHKSRYTVQLVVQDK
ncbi:MAG TPA: aspartate kinase [Bacteroidia bacterium]|jgi:aspartate kinase|nr:aspartate kinase [Bacteroidia bacterium]